MPLTLYKRRAIWHFRGTVAGRRLRGSTRTADKETAQQIAANREAREWKSHIHGPASVLTFAQAGILYRGAGKPTRLLARVEDHWKDTPIKNITAGAIRQSALTLYPNAGPATRNRQAIVPAQAVINHAAEMELCPRISVKRFPVPKREVQPATWDWIQAFMGTAGTPHLAALACFMFLTGARISEALAVGWDDVDLPGRRALIRSTKIGAERWAHLPGPLLAALANIEGERTGHVFRFRSRSTCKTQWALAIKKAGIKYLSYHACRHGFATAALQAGIDPVTVAKLGGWKTPAHVFATYGHAMEDATVVERLVNAPSQGYRERSGS